jgi:hypothetical protein
VNDVNKFFAKIFFSAVLGILVVFGIMALVMTR